MAFMIQPYSDPKSGIWKIRKGIPKHLRPFLDGKVELKRSLETKDAHVAKTRAAGVIAEFESAIARAQSRFDNQENEQRISASQLDAIVSYWVAHEHGRLTQADIQARYLLETPEGLASMTEWFSEPLEVLHEANGTSRQQTEEQRFVRHMSAFVDEALELSQCRLYDHSLRLYLAIQLANACIRLCNSAIDHEELARRKQGLVRRELNRGFEPTLPDTNIEPTDPSGDALQQLKDLGFIVTAMTTSSTAPSKQKEAELSVSSSVSQLIDWVNNQKKALSSEVAFRSWQGDRNRPCERLIEFFADKPIGDIQKLDMRKFFSWIIRCPSKPSQEIRALPFNKQIDIADKRGLARVSINTADKELKLISGYFQQAVKLDILPKNPCHQVSPGKETVRVIRDPGYSNAELTKIFSLPLFRQRTNAQKARYGEAPYWLPVILAYTGARAEEIAQLYVKDIKQDSDNSERWYFHIQELRDDQSVKTGESRRVPICQALIQLGLLDYLNTLPADGRLFPTLKPNSKAKYHLAVARYLKDAFKTLDIEHFDFLKPLHAFRHRFITEARKVMREDVQNAITGHSNAGNTGRNYGIYSELHQEIDKMSVIDIPKWCAQ
ncbi:site-specific integrase [Shewanella mangrovisoli]|uniref:site-specific integrase n=1 Tax=Shewanella mangrovisoli TaxID=2864211 RepID=UPI00313CCBDC